MSAKSRIYIIEVRDELYSELEILAMLLEVNFYFAHCWTVLHDKLFIHFYTIPLGKIRLNLEEAIKPTF